MDVNATEKNKAFQSCSFCGEESANSNFYVFVSVYFVGVFLILYVYFFCIFFCISVFLYLYLFILRMYFCINIFLFVYFAGVFLSLYLYLFCDGRLERAVYCVARNPSATSCYEINLLFMAFLASDPIKAPM